MEDEGAARALAMHDIYLAIYYPPFSRALSIISNQIKFLHLVRLDFLTDDRLNIGL